MDPIKKFLLAVWVIIICLILLPRLVTVAHYNDGHLKLFAYLQGNDKEPDVLLQNAKQSLLHVQNASVSNPRVNWRLALISFEEGQFDEATDFFLTARKTAPPDVLLTDEANRFFTSYRYHQLNALATAREDSPTNAVRAYRKAISIESREFSPELFRRYYSLLTKSDNVDEQGVGQRLQNLQANVQVSLSDFEQYMSPYLIPLASEDVVVCWELAGIRYDRAALEAGPLLPIHLHWRYMADPSRVYRETIIAANLAPNAGFEWGEQDGEPLGYPNTIYVEDNPEQNHQLLASEILSRTTTVAGLVNSAQHYNSSYASNAIPVNPEQLYFQGGWIKSDEGRAYIGHRWLGNLEGLDRRYQYVTGGVRNNDWAFYGRIVTIPAQIDAINFWLLNFNSEGIAYFDDLLFFEIEIPDCSIQGTP